MATFTFSLTGEDHELNDFIARLSGGTFAPAGPAPVDHSGLTAADKPKRAARKGDKPEEGSTPDATAASPATEPVTPLVQQTEAQTKLVDPAVAAAQAAGDTRKEPVVQPVKEATVIVEGGQPTAGAPGEVTLDHLKDELGKLLKKEGFGAKAAQDLIRQHGNGAAGLSQAAATDYRAIYDALVAANEA